MGSGRVLPRSHLIVQTYMDNIASKDEIIIDDVNFKGGLTMSQKIEDVGKKKATIG